MPQRNFPNGKQLSPDNPEFNGPSGDAYAQ
jgi:hypothetical protein